MSDDKSSEGNANIQVEVTDPHEFHCFRLILNPQSEPGQRIEIMLHARSLVDLIHKCSSALCDWQHQTTSELLARLGIPIDGKPESQKCRICGCTDSTPCIDGIGNGQPCGWVALELCSACAMQVAGAALDGNLLTKYAQHVEWLTDLFGEMSRTGNWAHIFDEPEEYAAVMEILDRLNYEQQPHIVLAGEGEAKRLIHEIGGA